MLDCWESRPVGIRMARAIPAWELRSADGRGEAQATARRRPGRRLAGKRVCICARRGRRRQDDHLRGARARAGGARAEGRGRDDRPGRAPGHALGLEELSGEPRRIDAALLRRAGRRVQGRAVGDDARRQAHLRRDRRAPRARRARARGDPRQPRSTASSPRRSPARRSSARWRSSTSSSRGARLRRDRARHAALAQRAGLPRRARRGCPASSKAARCRCSSRPAA